MVPAPPMQGEFGFREGRSPQVTIHVRFFFELSTSASSLNVLTIHNFKKVVND